VNKKVRGKNCKLCHEIHAGSQPFLMAEKVPFGTWQLPLHFEKTENGGTCSPGCHKPASYDRTKKIEFESK
jgi:predicted CXXCH cytochrome family protein